VRSNMRRNLLLGLLIFIALLGLVGLGGMYSRGVDAQENACVDLIVNGDFESDGGWEEYSSQGLHLISSFPPPSQSYHSGSRGAYLADYNNAEDRIYQEIALPADAISVTLTYWWQVDTEESSDLPRDALTVTLDAPLGTPITVLGVHSNLDAEAVWHQAEVDLSAYRGRTVVLRFEARTDGSLPTGFFIDDVSVITCQPEPTPTPTPQIHFLKRFLPLLYRTR